jgi:2-C-methyl-D-erythritol 4-phosphate cytidylyltransferase / 2-C-methyl-D-erythritol 2,4-cyclodiphosphate synthase
LAGRPVIAHTVASFKGVVDTVTVIGRSDEIERLTQLCGADGAVSLCVGGVTRQESVRAGLASLDADPNDIVLVHDGARPCISRQVIERCIEAVHENGSALVALPISETVKFAGDGGVVAATRDRDRLWCAQTPQGATAKIMQDAFSLAKVDGFAGTDESSLIERLPGCSPPKLVLGVRENIKITSREDMEFAERWLAAGKGNQPSVRVGVGYDIHRLTTGRKLVLGGIEIVSDVGLLGHSDADVVLHAICDALLGAAGLPDIGCLFPNDDDRFAGINSVRLLEDVVARVLASGYRVVNVDCCVIAERPKISPYAAQMRATIAAAIRTDESCVSVKATTNEGIGALGAGEGIACHATAVITAG